MTAYGWDASNHDWGRGPMDLAAAVRDGISFFTHKATEGSTYRDPYLGRAIQRARDAGMPVYGAYMVPRSGSPARVQVDFFLAYLDQQVPGWRTDPRFRILQMDTEHWANDKVAPSLGAQACALLRPLGKYVVHYAPAWAYGNSIPGSDPLWASSYGTNPAVPYRQAYPGDGSSGWAPYSGRTPVFLQYGSRAVIGSQPGCDINAFRGTVDDLRALITGGGSPMPSGILIAGEPLEQYLPRIERALLWQIPGIAADVAALKTAIGQVLAAQGATQEDVDALLARPAMVLDATQVTQLGADIGAVLAARPDNPLGEADIPTIQAAIAQFFRTHFAADTPAQG